MTAMKEVARHYGPSFALRTDRETGMTRSADFQEYLAGNGIRHLPTASSSPFTNGLVECKVKAVKQNIRAKASTRKEEDWDTYLDSVMWSLNKTVNTYGYCSEEVMYGFVSPSPLDLLKVTNPPGSVDEYVAAVTRKLAHIKTRIHELRGKKRILNENYKNSTRRRRTFRVGDIVYLRDRVIKIQSGLSAKFRGPYVIMEISAHEHTALLEDIVTGVQIKGHFNYMKSIDELPYPTQLNSNWDASIRAQLPVEQEAEDEATASQ
jgi:hypothetical protein